MLVERKAQTPPPGLCRPALTKNLIIVYMNYLIGKVSFNHVSVTGTNSNGYVDNNRDNSSVLGNSERALMRENLVQFD